MKTIDWKCANFSSPQSSSSWEQCFSWEDFIGLDWSIKVNIHPKFTLKYSFWWLTDLSDGKHVSLDSIEAPIICLAPHSSLFDILPYIVLGAPAVVAKREAKYTPFIGSVLLLSDPILVQRDCKLSRTETIRTIQHKAMKEKILIFPEGKRALRRIPCPNASLRSHSILTIYWWFLGTCTNRSSLIQFKLGAFLPGVSFQSWNGSNIGKSSHDLIWSGICIISFPFSQLPFDTIYHQKSTISHGHGKVLDLQE